MGSLYNEFKDLCYLLMCKCIQDAPFFKNWEGVAASWLILYQVINASLQPWPYNSEKLVEQFSSMLEIENGDLADRRTAPLSFGTSSVGCVCVKTYSSHLGEVTSVEKNKDGGLLLSGSKDNSNRLWDVRLARPIKRCKGHQNTSKTFVRASFGPDESLVVGGSEGYYTYGMRPRGILATSGEQQSSQSPGTLHTGQYGMLTRAFWSSA